MDIEVLILRALNYLRSTHLPSYVALRMLLESIEPRRSKSIVDALINQATIRKRHRVLELRRFKSNDGTKSLYRHYFVPSPSSALADAYALGVLHETKTLHRQADVFSYRPPPYSSFGRNFEYFADGYRERNDAIARALEVDGSVAVIADITNFYPSIDGDKAIGQLLDRFEATGMATARDVKIVESAARRAVSSEGLRIGMEMSHALASIYLASVDEAMRNRFPQRYFRYVDDIVVVAKREDVEDVLRALDQELETLGLKRNPKKDAVADRIEWSGYLASTKRSMTGGIDCLQQLKFRLKIFLSRNPEILGELDKTLRSQNIYLPLEQLLYAGRQVGWRRRVFEFIRSNWRVLLAYRFDRLEDVVCAAVDCRNEILSLLGIVLARGVSSDAGSVTRRWQVQSARFAINRALYFADGSDLASIIEFTKGVDELFEARVVCEALSGDFGGLALTPGPAVAAGTQLLSLRGGRIPEDVASISMLGGAEVAADFEAHLYLRELCESVSANHKWPDDLRGLISVARSERVELSDRVLSYGAEVSSLAINFSSANAVEIARTRFMAQESIVLDALSLDSAYLS